MADIPVPWSILIWHTACTTLCVDKRLISVLLTVFMMNGYLYGQSAPVQSLEEQIRTVPPNSAIEVRLNDGSKFRGWLSDVSGTGFVLTQEGKSQLEKKQIAFQQVRSMKRVKSVKPNHTTRNVLIGVGIGVGVLAITAAAIFASGSVTW